MALICRLSYNHVVLKCFMYSKFPIYFFAWIIIFHEAQCALKQQKRNLQYIEGTSILILEHGLGLNSYPKLPDTCTLTTRTSVPHRRRITEKRALCFLDTTAILLIGLHFTPLLHFSYIILIMVKTKVVSISQKVLLL